MAEASATPIFPTGQELWAPLPQFEGRYEISTHGRVRILRGHPRDVGRIMRQQRDKYGYAHVFLVPPPVVGKIGRSRRRVFVHVAVAAVFLGPRPKGFHAAHLDGDAMNPCLENIAYVTPAENLRHRIVHGTVPDCRGERSFRAKLSNQQAAEIRLRRARTYETLEQLGAEYGVSRETIRNICNGSIYQSTPLR